jgi:pimeloyl-ACP methyl ester carboxylesterase
MSHAMAAADLGHVLPRIPFLLLLYGARDLGSPRDAAAELQVSIPGSKLAELPGVGHQCNIESASRLKADVRAFSRGLNRHGSQEPEEGLEPTAYALQVRCSTS